MTTTTQPDALPGKAQLSAWLLCRKPAVLRFRDIGEAVHKLAPRSTVKSMLEDGALLLEVDGIAVAVFTVEGQAPVSMFDVGPYPHLYMRDPVQACRDHKGYLIIQAPGEPADKAEALAKARAVTLVTRAAAIATEGIAASWLDAGQITPISILDTDMKLVVEPNGVAPNFWVRKLVTGGSQSGELIFGTRGLAAFGAFELEWAPTRRPLEEMLAIVTATVRYVLSSPEPLADGHTITFDAAMKFGLARVEPGQFASPVLRVSQVQ
jgi:hypothetical protein